MNTQKSFENAINGVTSAGKSGAFGKGTGLVACKLAEEFAKRGIVFGGSSLEQ